ncbi:hypothetical protein JCM24511_04574 [Saitozyma sp. JCM 24511]|nr:hypothetical protein JCM24511_04574 [Saitozyma sp. JCM 24511]
MILDTLPVEMIHKVVTVLCDSEEDWDAQQTILSLCCTNRTLYTISKEHLFEHAILTIPRTSRFFDIIAEDASLGEKSLKLGSKVKSLCFRLPPPAVDWKGDWDLPAWRQERIRMAEDAIRSASRLNEPDPESPLLPHLKVVAFSGENAQWWQRWEPYVFSSESLDQLQMTNTLIRRLI